MPSTNLIWSTPWLRPLNDVAAIDDLLAQVHPTWSLGRLKARVLEVVAETPAIKTFVLRPNRHWPGFRAGQHVGVEVEIAGVRHQRRYSLSSAPDPERIAAITVKRHPGGKVSNWLHDHLRSGDTLTLAAPAGSFVLPNPLPTRLLMLSAGSGITPLMAMLRSVARSVRALDLDFVHVARRREDAPFASELDGLAARIAGLRVHRYPSAELGRFTPIALARRVPDYDERSTFLCGPGEFMKIVRSHFAERGLAGRLSEESFGISNGVPSAADGTYDVRCARSERLFTATGAMPLLVAAEQAGLRPRYGCRMGICHSCTCLKRSGAVEDVRTGAVSSEPDERIQLCVSRARTDLTLDL